MTAATYLDVKKDASLLLTYWTDGDGGGATQLARSIAADRGQPYADRVVQFALTIEQRRADV